MDKETLVINHKNKQTNKQTNSILNNCLQFYMPRNTSGCCA